MLIAAVLLGLILLEHLLLDAPESVGLLLHLLHLHLKLLKLGLLARLLNGARDSGPLGVTPTGWNWHVFELAFVDGEHRFPFLPLAFAYLVDLLALVRAHVALVEQVVLGLEVLNDGKHPRGVQLLVHDVFEQLHVGNELLVDRFQDADQDTFDDLS